MKSMQVRLLSHSRDHVLALRHGAEAYERFARLRLAPGIAEMVAGPEVSSLFLARQLAVPGPDIWLHGFGIVLVDDQIVIGLCGYKGPPDKDGAVEIAYGVAPSYQGKGYATQAALELVSRAFSSSQVRLVRAHTLPAHNSSTRVLSKCGFAWRGQVIDPEDGPVWRWERTMNELPAK
jgi:ribosomal-protein-alanine N-acetyltransferase